MSFQKLGPQASVVSSRYLPPVERGLEFFNLFIHGAAGIARNLVRDKPQPSLTGSPTYGSGYARFSPAAFLDSLLDDFPQFTFFAVCRGVGVTTDPATRPIFMGDYGGSTVALGGTSLFVKTSVAISGIINTNDGGSSVFVEAAITRDPNAWGMPCVTFDGTTLTTRDLARPDIAPVSAAITHSRAFNAATTRIGAGYSASFGGTCDLHAAGICSVALNPTEQAAWYARLKASAGRRGIVI
ncbi:hypothetical protein [Ensifer soli]|uniref:hypothetical protein n=1 Tax=Ciceribacter sp. sgz301302 TaxID=3342379 RepID=UPI0035B9C3FC